MATALQLPCLHRGPVRLRAFTAADAPAVQEASSDPFIPLNTTVPAAPADDAAVQAIIERQNERARTEQGYSFAIADAATDAALGQVGLWPLPHERASIGYWIVPSARGRGLASLALAVVSGWGLDLPEFARLELYVEPWNKGSWRAAEKVGYQREGLLRSWQEVGGQRRDMYMYALLRGRSRLTPTAAADDLADGAWRALSAR